MGGYLGYGYPTDEYYAAGPIGQGPKGDAAPPPFPVAAYREHCSKTMACRTLAWLLILVLLVLIVIGICWTVNHVTNCCGKNGCCEKKKKQHHQSNAVEVSAAPAVAESAAAKSDAAPPAAN